ncbi:MAG: HyaD/HybD family hydrogenase maturation endopeptidase [Planctomycetota bacterium]|nr:MAG: HyaD/HybD family hydrogenase maturation endopeptidase [Planctomycetota bacterium]
MQKRADTSLAVIEEQKRCNKRRILVLGLGNILLKDEGVGVHVVGQLQKRNLSAKIEVIDGGTAGLDILLSQEGLDKLVVIDALRAGKKPGTIYRTQFSGKDRLTEVFSREEDFKISLHQIGLLDALAAAGKMNCAPKEIVIIGVEPAEVDYGLELTDEVKKRIPEIVNVVLKEIKDDIYRE